MILVHVKLVGYIWGSDIWNSKHLKLESLELVQLKLVQLKLVQLELVQMTAETVSSYGPAARWWRRRWRQRLAELQLIVCEPSRLLWRSKWVSYTQRQSDGWEAKLKFGGELDVTVGGVLMHCGHYSPRMCKVEFSTTYFSSFVTDNELSESGDRNRAQANLT